MYETATGGGSGRLRVAMQNVELCDAWISRNTAGVSLGTTALL